MGSPLASGFSTSRSQAIHVTWVQMAFTMACWHVYKATAGHCRLTPSARRAHMPNCQIARYPRQAAMSAVHTSMHAYSATTLSAYIRTIPSVQSAVIAGGRMHAQAMCMHAPLLTASPAIRCKLPMRAPDDGGTANHANNTMFTAGGVPLTAAVNLVRQGTTPVDDQSRGKAAL